MRFAVLGPLEVRTQGDEVVPVKEAKVRSLLVALLAAQERPVSADRLIELLWPDSPPANPTGSLQVKVSQLRRALDRAADGGRALLGSTSAGYVLSAPAEDVDFRHFDALTARALSITAPAERVAALDEALALWRGAAFDGFADESSVYALAAGLEEQRLVVLEERAHARLELGEHQSLIGELTELAERHPLRERLRTAQLLALYRSGRSVEALRLYDALRTRLAEEFGVDPGPGLVRLHHAMLQQDRSLRADADRPTVRGSNVPAPLTGLVGRARVLARIRETLAANRLVTLVGPGGVGKTRLATEVAREADGQSADGTWLVELAGLPPASACTADDLAEVVAAALDLREEPVVDKRAEPRSATERLVATLQDRRTLLVLDNCEHVLAASAELVSVLLAGAPGLRVLATSRELLGVVGEQLVEVPPLDLPAPGASPAVIARFSSVELFLARARSAVPGFAPRPRDLETVAAICRRLDGIPLAIEMAVARVRALGLDELLVRLADRFRVLGVGVERRGVPARQQTLRAMIDWSWELCTEPERLVLARLSAHAQGCRLEAAERTCAGGPVDAADVPSVLGRLVDRSLVVVGEDAGRPRYRLLESMAEYGRQRLAESGEAEATALAHAEYYSGLVAALRPELCGPRQRDVLSRLDVETANLERALQTWLWLGRHDRAVRHVNDQTWYWFLRGRLSEAQRRLRLVLGLAHDAGSAPDVADAEVWHRGFTLLSTGVEPTGPRAPAGRGAAGDGRAWWFLAYARWSVGAFAESAELNSVLLPHFRAVGDRWGTAASTATAAALAVGRGDLRTLDAAASECLRLFQALGDGWGLLKATDLLGVLAEIRGDRREATRLHEEGLGIAADLGLWGETARKLAMLGRMAMLAGDYPIADDLHGRAAALAKQQANMPWQVFAESGLAISYRRQGRLAEAEALLTGLVPAMRRMQALNGLALTLAELGFLAEQRGDAAAARAHHAEGLEAALATGDRRAVALAAEGLAGAHRLAGRPDAAARLLGVARAIRDALDAPLHEEERRDVDRITAAARDALGEAAFAELVAEGEAAERARAADGGDFRAAHPDLC
ncbi:BTAD domain-containing putative transcriptional regulator [Saccharothrix australiensis]|uniref:BTAD domain-containing putative transcriptional regulator n=1 Tax=Saccharothrix australiensis TaxID=2072 RepID=UPI000EAC9670|nr:BTAD domain-containing putative transcriptional regulator [Saccharothrix australiensis]